MSSHGERDSRSGIQPDDEDGGLRGLLRNGSKELNGNLICTREDFI